MFSRYIPAVVPMNTQFLAKHDGSDESAGRGSGRDGDVEKGAGRPQQTQMTPYMSNTYWITERRLDTAIWRALFASSARQARQFVVHGRVKVNGRVVSYSARGGVYR
jgi:ribosomal protein S4